MNPGEDRAKDLTKRLRTLQAERVNFDTTWERIARLCLPHASGFLSTTSPGANLNSEIYDSTGAYALPRFAAAIDTLVTPHTSRWHVLAPSDKARRSDPAAARAMSWMTDVLFSARYAPQTGFAARANEVYSSLGAFGNGVMYIADARPGLRYISIHLSEIWFAENDFGVIDTAFWVHAYTNRQLVLKFGDAVPAEIREAEKKAPEGKVHVCKAVYPRTERDPRRRDNKNMPFASVTFIIGSAGSAGSFALPGATAAGIAPSAAVAPTILEETGYRTFPFAVARYTTAPREIYGRGPAHEVLADMLTLQEMAKTQLRAGQLAVDPTILAQDVDAIDTFTLRPGVINYGALDMNGVERYKPFKTGGSPEFSLELQDQRRRSVNEAFLLTLFQALVDTGTDRMTATEVMQRVQEKGALLAPVGGRLRTEFLGRIIERELDILFHAGVFRAEDLPDWLVADGRIEIEYDSPLSRAMRADEGLGILRTVDAGRQLEQMKPGSVTKFNGNRIIERLAEVNGAPPDILFTDEEVAAQKNSEQLAAGAAQTAQLLPGVAQSAKLFAQARQIEAGAKNTAGII